MTIVQNIFMRIIAATSKLIIFKIGAKNRIRNEPLKSINDLNYFEPFLLFSF